MTARTTHLAHQLLTQRKESLLRELQQVGKELATIRQETWDTVVNSGEVNSLKTGERIDHKTQIGCGLINDFVSSILEGAIHVEDKDGRKFLIGIVGEYIFKVPVED